MARLCTCLFVVALLLTSSCKQRGVSSGSCEGAVGAQEIDAQLGVGSAFSLAWDSAAAPTVLYLDCGGKLTMFAEMDRTPGKTTWTIPSDDPACYAQSAADAGQPVVTPACTFVDGFGWTLNAPKVRPRLATGTLEAALDDKGHVLRGKADLRFEDGSRSAIDFALAYGPVVSQFPRGVDVSGVPGRISFTGK